MTRASMRFGIAAVSLWLAACAGVPPADVQPSASAQTPEPAQGEDPRIVDLRAKVDRLSSQLADAQRRYHALNEEHRRTEAALRENQKRLDDLQQKLDALLEIDRDTRKRWRP